jgi:TfoX/Sxy family transcriptional regulator of competence genes
VLSLIGGAFSLLVGLIMPTIYPEYFDYLERFNYPEVYDQFFLSIGYFLIAIRISLIIGGIITILGAVLYSVDKPSSGIVILIGAFLGGINIISLFGGRIAFVECSRIKKMQKLVKKDEILRRAEKVIRNYLEKNKGKAFTAVALRKRCVEDNQLELSLADIEKLLNDLHLLGRIRSDAKENVNYYFVS